LDTWRRSGLPAGDFALVGLSKHTLYVWKKRFERTARVLHEAGYALEEVAS
jgi:hypothetical protein